MSIVFYLYFIIYLYQGYFKENECMTGVNIRQNKERYDIHIMIFTKNFINYFNS